jgi:DHA1 family tetracycline resistance protein-like MFS transporter
MFKALRRDHWLLMTSLLIWAMGEGLWMNFRQLHLEQLGAAPPQIGLALAIESVARAALLIPAGFLIDRIGARYVMLASWFLGIAGVFIGGLATSWQGFMPGLVIYGLSYFAGPAVSTYSLMSIPEQDVPAHSQRVLTTVYAAFPAGLILSPALGGLVAEHFGIRTCLWLAVILSGISTTVVLMTGHVEPHPLAKERRAGDLLRNRTFVGLVSYYMLAMLPVYLGFVLLPNFLQQEKGLSYAIIGTLFSIVAAGTVVVNLLAGKMTMRWGPTMVLVAIWLALLGIWQLSFVPGIGVAAFVLGGVYSLRTVATTSLAHVVQPQDRGMAFGTLELLLTLSMAVAAGAAGQLYDMSPGHDLPLIVALTCIPLLIGVWLVLRTPRRQEVLSEAAPGGK